MMTFDAANATDVGNTRASNQDAVSSSDRLCIVADGMGGHAGGEVAAQSAVSGIVRAFQENPSAKGLLAGTKSVNREIFERAEAEEPLHGMGTTLVAVAIVPHRGQERLALINVGDSRAYLLEEGELEQLTDDHSLVEEMLRQQEITAQEAAVHPYRHVLTRAVGISDRVDVDTWTFTPEPGARLLLCSDGLTNECPDHVIKEILLTHAEPADAAYALIRRSLDHGGNDNITVVVADILSDDEPDDDELFDIPAQVSPRERRPPHKAHAKAPREARARRTPIENLGEQLMTFRVALFCFVLAGVLAGALGFTVWFDKASYFIGESKNNVAIFNGRPGGFLWFRPTLVTTTPLKISAVLPANLPLIREGMLEPSYATARQIVANLTNEQAAIAALSSAAATGVNSG